MWGMDMRRPTLGGGFLAALLAFSPALGSEIVHFKNGTTMAVLGHEVEGEMIHVQLAADSRIAFPAGMVERIVKAGEEVFRSSGEATLFKNQMQEGVPTPVIDTSVSGRPASHQIRGHWIGREEEGNPNVGRDGRSGLAVYKPWPDSDNPHKQARGLTGRLDMLDSPPANRTEGADPAAPGGARPFGRGYIAKMPEDTGIGRPKFTSLSKDMNSPKSSPPPEDADPQ